MDNNKPQPNQTAPIVPEVESSGEGNKTVVWFIVGLVLIGVVVGGLYWYMSKQQTTSGNSNPTGYTAPKTTTANTPTTTLDQDLDAINVQASDSGDFNSIDQDLKSL